MSYVRSKSQITVVGCGNATGQAIPPFIIFAAKQLNHLWMKNEVPGSRYGVSDKGWIDQELFHFWLQDHFLTHAGSHRPLLLLLDGHSSHFSPATIRFAKENDVAMFCLPPHPTHECQPLDCSLFGPLKVHWKQACHVFYQKNAGRVLSKLNFCRVFRDAWFKAITPDNICSGFRKAGVYPFKPQAVLCQDNIISKQPESHRDDNDSDSEESRGNDDNSDGELGSHSTDTSLVTTTNRFTPKQVELFEERLQEGYDIIDPEYISWLEIYHPAAVPADRYTLTCAPFTLADENTSNDTSAPTTWYIRNCSFKLVKGSYTSW